MASVDQTSAVTTVTFLPHQGEVGQKVKAGRAYLANLMKRNPEVVKKVIAEWKLAIETVRNEAAAENRYPSSFSFEGRCKKAGEFLTEEQLYPAEEWNDPHYLTKAHHGGMVVSKLKKVVKRAMDANQVQEFLWHKLTSEWNGVTKFSAFCDAVAKGSIKTPEEVAVGYEQRVKMRIAESEKAKKEQAEKEKLASQQQQANSPAKPPEAKQQNATPKRVEGAREMPGMSPSIVDQAAKARTKNLQQPSQQEPNSQPAQVTPPSAPPTSQRSKSCLSSIVNALSRAWNSLKSALGAMKKAIFG